MAQAQLDPRASATWTSFAAMLDETLGTATASKAPSSRAVSSRSTTTSCIVDVGLKSEGRVAAQGIRRARAASRDPGRRHGRGLRRAVRGQGRRGRPVAREGRREESLDPAREGVQRHQRVNGTIFGRVKGGFTVDLGGAVAFLPGSQVDIRPVRDIGPLMGTPAAVPDPQDGPLAAATSSCRRRAVLEESRAEQRTELVQT